MTEARQVSLPPQLGSLVALLGPPSGAPLDTDSAAARLQDIANASPGLATALRDLLAAHNGGRGFEGALTLLPLDGKADPEIRAANRAWQDAYGPLSQAMTAFGFGGLGDLCVLTRDGVGWFDPETGETELVGTTLEQWATDLLDDYDMRTGHSLVRAWQVENGRLLPGEVLRAERPFVLGGAYDPANLRRTPIGQSFTSGARLARALAGRPDGTTLSWPLPDKPEE